MELIRLSPKEHHHYIKFYQKIYRSYPKKKEDMGGFLEKILKGKSPLNQRLDFETVLIYRNKEPIMGAVLARCQGLPEYLQISFFEAVEKNREAFLLILQEAVVLGKKWDCKTLTGGLNLHVNYGLGFLDLETDEAGFGMNYNPTFYNELFLEAGFSKRELVTYQLNLKDYHLPLKEETRRGLKKRYIIEKARWKDVKTTVQTYTKLNNRCFKEHLYYYPRVMEEDYELFKPFSWLLRDENLLFVYRRDGEGKKASEDPVGFMLWYPDYNELIPHGGTITLKTLWDLKIRKKKIEKMKIVEMGIVPKERNRGAILALFQELESYVIANYQYLESSWVLGNNEPSKGFGIRWADGEGKGYGVYERKIHEDKGI